MLNVKRIFHVVLRLYIFKKKELVYLFTECKNGYVSKDGSPCIPCSPVRWGKNCGYTCNCQHHERYVVLAVCHIFQNYNAGKLINNSIIHRQNLLAWISHDFHMKFTRKLFLEVPPYCTLISRKCSCELTWIETHTKLMWNFTKQKWCLSWIWLDLKI